MSHELQRIRGLRRVAEHGEFFVLLPKYEDPEGARPLGRGVLAPTRILLVIKAASFVSMRLHTIGEIRGLVVYRKVLPLCSSDLFGVTKDPLHRPVRGESSN